MENLGQYTICSRHLSALQHEQEHKHAVPLQTGTAIRETIYTGSYLGLCPVLQTYIDRTAFAREGPPGASLVVSGISTGLLASVVTQPIDTAKTRMQAFMDPKVTHLNMQTSSCFTSRV